MILHTLSVAVPQRRVVRVEVSCDLPGAPDTQDVVFPVWTPGSYLVREHMRHVHELTAEADGRPAGVEKVAKNVYRVRTTGARAVRLRYEVYAHELTVRTSHVDPSHAFLNPVAILPFLPGREGEAQRLELRDLPAGWGVACALPDAGDHAFEARDYDELADSPLECGPHAHESVRREFTVHGVRHELVHWGRSTLDLTRFTDDLTKIVEAQAAMFGGLPYERYLFIAHASDAGRGGLEHRASCALLYPRGTLLKPKGYEDLLGLVSHELFHAWNVKRIKPAAFTPYDLTRENHTRLLWAFEGFTSYYEDIFLRRAGLMTRARYLEIMGERLTQLARTPGRRRHPVAEASFDAWIRYYRQDENSENSSVSYYLKGALIGALLDLELRRRTGGAKTLDDAMRLLWDEHGRTGVGVPEDGVERAVERVAGTSLREIFDVAIRGTGELPFDEALLAHGLKLQRRVAVGPDDRGGSGASGEALRCDVGMNLKTEGERVRISSVRRDSPAEAAGVVPGDELVAIDGLRADGATAHQRLHAREPGLPVEVALFRRDELVTLAITTGQPREDTLQVIEDPAARPEAKARLEQWLGGE